MERSTWENGLNFERLIRPRTDKVKFKVKAGNNCNMGGKRNKKVAVGVDINIHYNTYQLGGITFSDQNIGPCTEVEGWSADMCCV